MVELLRLRMAGLQVAASAWIALVFLVLLFEVFLQVGLFPLSVHPLRHIRQRHRRALNWLQRHGRGASGESDA